MSPFYESHACTGESVSCMFCVSHVQQSYQVAELFQSSHSNTYNDCKNNFAMPLKYSKEEALENAFTMMEASKMHNGLHLQHYQPNYQLREPQILPYEDNCTLCTSHIQQSYPVDKRFQSPYSNSYDNYYNNRYYYETPTPFSQKATIAAIPLMADNSSFYNTFYYPTNQPDLKPVTAAATPIKIASPSFYNTSNYQTNQPDLKPVAVTPMKIASPSFYNTPHYQTIQPDSKPAAATPMKIASPSFYNTLHYQTIQPYLHSVKRACSPITVTSTSLLNTHQCDTMQSDLQQIEKQTLYSPPLLAETSRESVKAFATPITIDSSSLHDTPECDTTVPDLLPVTAATTSITIVDTFSLHETPHCHTNKPDFQVTGQQTLQSTSTLAEISREPDVQLVKIATSSVHDTSHCQIVNKADLQIIKVETLQSSLIPTKSLSENENDSDCSIIEVEDTDDESHFCQTEYFVQEWIPQSTSDQEDSWSSISGAQSVSPKEIDVIDQSPSSAIKMEVDQSSYDNSESTSNTFSPYVTYAGLQDPLWEFYSPTINDTPTLNDELVSKEPKSQKRSYVRCTCPYCSVEGGNKTKGPNGKPQHICHIPHCERIFSSSSDLKIHLDWHSGEKNYVCDKCNMGYLRKNQLRRHMETHRMSGRIVRRSTETRNTSPKSSETNTDNVRPQLACRIAGCGKIFYHAKYLNTHLKRDHGVKPYVCTWPKCDRSFNASRSLQIHLKSHRSMEIFVCPYCRRRFSGDASLKRHISCAHEKIWRP